MLLAATAVALLLANSPLAGLYEAVRDHPIGPNVLHLRLTVGEWAADGLLALFFFVVGLELKRELVTGELANLKAAALPIVAAIGGMVVPAAIAVAVAAGEPGIERAWAIPMATDIAFALGVLALTASRMPSSARVFLLSLAVVDDLGAIVVIAVLFTHSLNLLAVAAAVLLLALYAYLQHRRTRTAWLYVPIALGTWVAVHEAGVHATIAGIALGLLSRARADRGESYSPALRLEHRLQPYSAGVAVPLFALTAAGVSVGAGALGALMLDRIAIATMAGLIVGKLLGILGACWVTVRLGLAVRPQGMGWRDLFAVAMLGGVGFTVSLLIAELALQGAAAERAKAAVLIASVLASLLATLLLLRRNAARNEPDTEPAQTI